MPGILAGEPLRRFRHELRTPLNHIIGFADILLDDAEEGGRPELVPALREIRTGGMALLESMQIALPGEIDSVDRAQLEQVAETLRPSIAGLLARCTALEGRGVFGAEDEGLEHLQTIAWALGQMETILDEGVRSLG
jgi:signal transduction histidine kinase